MAIGIISNNSNSPSPIKRRNISPRVAPFAMRMAISGTRVCVRNQNVPKRPRKILTARNSIMVYRLRLPFSEFNWNLFLI